MRSRIFWGERAARGPLFFDFVDVLDGEHGDEVEDLFKAVEGFPADALGRGVGVGEFGVPGFEVAEFVEELVVVGVGDFGGCFGVVEAIVPVEFGAELGDAFDVGHAMNIEHRTSNVQHRSGSRGEKSARGRGVPSGKRWEM